jgi:hypothetical protein
VFGDDLKLNVGAAFATAAVKTTLPASTAIDERLKRIITSI